VLSAGVLVVMVRRQLLMPTSAWSEIVGYLALGCLSGVLLVSALNVKKLSFVWENAPLRFLGRYSYGLYIWHEMTIAELQQHVIPPGGLPVIGGSHLPANAAFVLLALVTSIGVALVSWYAIEYPFLKLKALLPYGKTGKTRRASATAAVSVPVARLRASANNGSCLKPDRSEARQSPPSIATRM